MKWPVVDNSQRLQPTKGSYGDWKEQIARDCSHKCVYCAIGEDRFGGIRNFHVEHYRPKSKNAALVNVIQNLYYACSICNGLKGADWPGDPLPNLSTAAYADPGGHDFNTLLKVDAKTYGVSSDKTTARYMIERLILNRPQLVAERRLHAFQSSSNDAVMQLSSVCKVLIFGELVGREKSLLVEALDVTRKLVDLGSRLSRARPYRREDVSR